MIDLTYIKKGALQVGDIAYFVEQFGTEYELVECVVVGVSAYIKAGQDTPKVKYRVVHKHADNINDTMVVYAPIFKTKESAVLYKLKETEDAMKTFIDSVNEKVDSFEKMKSDLRLLLNNKGGQ